MIRLIARFREPFHDMIIFWDRNFRFSWAVCQNHQY